MRHMDNHPQLQTNFHDKIHGHLCSNTALYNHCIKHVYKEVGILKPLSSLIRWVLEKNPASSWPPSKLKILKKDFQEVEGVVGVINAPLLQSNCMMTTKFLFNGILRLRMSISNDGSRMGPMLVVGHKPLIYLHFWFKAIKGL